MLPSLKHVPVIKFFYQVNKFLVKHFKLKLQSERQRQTNFHLDPIVQYVHIVNSKLCLLAKEKFLKNISRKTLYVEINKHQSVRDRERWRGLLAKSQLGYKKMAKAVSR